MPTTPPRRAVAVAALSLAIGALSACGSSKAVRTDQPDAETREAFGFTSQAQDPTARNREAGYDGFFRAAPEPEGTESQLSPERRSHGFGAGGSDDL